MFGVFFLIWDYLTKPIVEHNVLKNFMSHDARKSHLEGILGIVFWTNDFSFPTSHLAPSRFLPFVRPFV